MKCIANVDKRKLEQSNEMSEGEHSSVKKMKPELRLIFPEK